MRRLAGVAGVQADWRCARLRATFPGGFEEQREAAEIALAQAVTVLTGGPGTGKTTTVARLLALLAEQAGSRNRGRGSRWRRRPARRRRGCRKPCSMEVAKLDAADRGAAR